MTAGVGASSMSAVCDVEQESLELQAAHGQGSQESK